MKTTGIPTSSIFDRLSVFTKELNSNIVKLQKESVTGQISDYGLQLGARVTGVLELEQEKVHSEEILNDNNLANKSLSISKINLGDMSMIVQDTLEDLIALQHNNDEVFTKQIFSKNYNSYKSFMTCANMTDGGRYLFSGINTSEKPLNDYFDKDSLAKKSFDQMLQVFLEENSKLVGQNIEVSSMSGQQMTDFIKKLEDKFLDDEYWSKNWSNASNQNIQYRVRDTNNIDVSVNINTTGIRNFMLFSVIGIELASKNLTESARQVLNLKMISAVQKASLDINHQHASLGVSEQKIDKEKVFLQEKINIIDVLLLKSVGVDEYKTSSQLSGLMNKVEMSYMITAKLHKLSLLNYL
ncbi:flagellar hook-associated family protein [Candidatus Liberibacter africanus]|uniref:Flagellar hook-associated protein FlgL n=1 Tax=Candidatus Liberibacter africanus PTSAPSY TaxID=1277257 RepID=A0A0G3I7B0_LIBAF|nr:flagellar hook-associated family protein [Candidatus Liberibacter africanus]AKK20378.1 flagellar hook-associated protein FlgL [Candidatus Liberibacter africanus PTSAPSY]QTP64114.1 flagellar hook-associated family protein [Candidatus Liberibacter africanus]